MNLYKKIGTLVIAANLYLCASEDSSQSEIHKIITEHRKEIKELAPFRMSYKYQISIGGKKQDTVYSCDLLALKDGRFISSKVVIQNDKQIGGRNVRAWTKDAFYSCLRPTSFWRLDAKFFKSESFTIAKTEKKITRESPQPLDIIGMGSGRYRSTNAATPCHHISAYDYLMTADRYCVPKSERLFMRWCDITDDKIALVASKCLSLEKEKNGELDLKINSKSPGIPFSIPCDVDISYKLQKGKNGKWQTKSLTRQGEWKPEYIYKDAKAVSPNGIICPQQKEEVNFIYKNNIAKGIIPAQTITTMSWKEKEWTETYKFHSEIKSFETLTEDEAEEAIALFPLSIKGFHNAGKVLTASIDK